LLTHTLWFQTAFAAGSLRHGETAKRGLAPALPNASHHWTFNGASTDGVGGIVGELEGSAKYSDADTIEGGMSLHLPCCDSKVILNDAALKQAFTQHTVSLWFKAVQTGGYRYLYEEGGAVTGFAIRLNGVALEVAVIEGGGGPGNVKFASTGPVAAGKWHHAVAVYNNGEISITLDGSMTATSNTGFGELSKHRNAAAIGSGGLTDYKSDLHFVGMVDDVRIWDSTALTSIQISELYSLSAPGPSDTRPNFLLIVADDMNHDSPGFVGGVAPNVSPNLDKLASESRVFSRAHAADSVCQPSRQAMLSGKYPPNYGSVGFFPMREGTRTAVSSLHDAGYLTANFHKMAHMRPYSSFPWDMTEQNTHLEGRERYGIGRSPTLLGEATKQTIAAAKASYKPFFLVINSADTHR
jgi:hypothetical protein